MKNYLRTLLSFSRKELNGMLVLFGLLLLLVLSQPLTDWLVRKPDVDFSGFEREIGQLELSEAGPASTDTGWRSTENWEAGETIPRPAGSESAQRALFPFDPNKASKDDLLKLGLRPKVVSTLLNYRKAGGRFRHKEELKKVYGLEQSAYEQLLPFVRIEEQEGLEKQASYNHSGTYPVVEINTADSAALLPLPGIGPVLSARIIKYRKRLGGFYSPEQLLEVYGMDTANYRIFRTYLRVDTSLLIKIDLNKAEYRELKRLPYWSSSQVNTLLNYRGQHGDFSELEELNNIRALEDHIIQKVIPYLSLE